MHSMLSPRIVNPVKEVRTSHQRDENGGKWAFFKVGVHRQGTAGETTLLYWIGKIVEEEDVQWKNLSTCLHCGDL